MDKVIDSCPVCAAQVARLKWDHASLTMDANDIGSGAILRCEIRRCPHCGTRLERDESRRWRVAGISAALR
jgi:endogenous inhibitor of DNA gyrase (YacG/DUF329 family)